MLEALGKIIDKYCEKERAKDAVLGKIDSCWQLLFMASISKANSLKARRKVATESA